jgi:glycine/serine hydroxymethyltransferase
LKAQVRLAKTTVKAFKAPKAISVRIANIKKALKNAVTPARRAALKKQLKAAKKVAALKKALKRADPYQKEAILRKLAIAKKFLKKTAAKAAATRPKPIRARIAAIKAKLARA